MIIGDRIMRYIILPEHTGRTVADFLGKRFPYHTVEEWGRFAGAGAVSVNDRPAGAGLVLNENDVIGYCAGGVTEPRVDEAITILYEDRDIIVVNKTGNLPVHPAGKYFKNTLWGILKDRFDVAEPSIINRLDRETSGVTLVAKNRRAADICRQQFNCRSVIKKYTALAEGVLERPVHARGYIVNCADSAIRKKRRFEPAGGELPEPGREAEWAETKFTPLERHGGLSVVEAVPHTGRLHQIRATLSFLGCPVAGDKMYGLDEGIFLRFIEERTTPQDAAKMRIGRQALHASELSFNHPSDGRPMAVAAPMPPDMRGLLGI
jgi:23S rRNA pseudouridine955/2504/2580 synthase/23S rRNA pseudouridine1911/1915/1917 synthase